MKHLATTFFLFFLLQYTAVSQTQSKGWKSLFDGKTLSGWKQLTGTAPFDVVDGEIVGSAVVGKVNSFLASEELYGDFILELETKIQDSTINSGIQFRSFLDQARGLVYGYQFELDGSSRRWSGGIYDEEARLALSPHTSSRGKTAF